MGAPSNAIEPEVTLRFYRPGDEDGLVDLLQASFDTWPKPHVLVPARDYVAWKLSNDPDALRFQVIAEADSKIIGCRLFFLQHWRVRGEPMLCRSGFDLAVHPDYRRHGVLAQMWAFARRHFDTENDFNFGVGDNPAALRMRATQGNITIENKVQVLVHTLDPLTSVPPPSTPVAFEVKDIRAFDGRVDGFFEEACRPFDFIRERTMDFLNWRYCDVRGGDFVIRQAEQEGKVLGYIAFRETRGIGSIGDLLALPGRLDVVERLIQEALRHLLRAGLSTVECWMPSHHPHRAALLHNGFLHKRRVVPLSYRHLRAPASHFSFLQEPRAAVHIMAGETDLV